MQGKFRNRGRAFGGAIGYPSNELFEEVAYIAYHFHWPYNELMNLSHIERRQWMQEIVKINERLNASNSDENESSYVL